MQSLRCLRAAALAKPTLTPCIRQIPNPQYQSIRSLSILTLRRPQFLGPSSATSSLPASFPSPATTNGALIPTSASTLDLMPKISSHPGLAGTQIRCGPRDTYNMTHRVRKRRCGFLARLRTKDGRAILKRRRLKGRKNLAHR